MKWRFENGIPIYLQILRKMRTEIASGAYPPGGKLPPVRELALEAGVNPNTMQRAFAELERDGLVFSQRTSGRFVTEDEEALRQIRRSLSEEIINELCTRLTHLGMDREEIRAAVDAWASGNLLSAESEKEIKPERELSPEREIMSERGLSSEWEIMSERGLSAEWEIKPEKETEPEMEPENKTEKALETREED